MVMFGRGSEVDADSRRCLMLSVCLSVERGRALCAFYDRMQGITCLLIHTVDNEEVRQSMNKPSIDDENSLLQSNSYSEQKQRSIKKPTIIRE